MFVYEAFISVCRPAIHFIYVVSLLTTTWLLTHSLWILWQEMSFRSPMLAQPNFLLSSVRSSKDESSQWEAANTQAAVVKSDQIGWGRYHITLCTKLCYNHKNRWSLPLRRDNQKQLSKGIVHPKIRLHSLSTHGCRGQWDKTGI